MLSSEVTIENGRYITKDAKDGLENEVKQVLQKEGLTYGEDFFWEFGELLFEEPAVARKAASFLNNTGKFGKATAVSNKVKFGRYGAKDTKDGLKRSEAISFLRSKFAGKKAMVEEYISEAEHQDGQGYWSQYFSNTNELADDFLNYAHGRSKDEEKKEGEKSPKTYIKTYEHLGRRVTIPEKDARCKSSDITYGGKGYICKSCGATDVFPGHIKHKTADSPFECCGSTTQAVSEKERYCQTCKATWKKVEGGWSKQSKDSREDDEALEALRRLCPNMTLQEAKEHIASMKKMNKDAEETSYKGYTIKESTSGWYIVWKGDKRIAQAPSIESAKKAIDSGKVKDGKDEGDFQTEDARDGAPPTKADVEKFAPQAPASLKSHPMWSPTDYAYMRKKGYSNEDIKKLWERDRRQGNTPMNWELER